jgi:hypothetical protein
MVIKFSRQIEKQFLVRLRRGREERRGEEGRGRGRGGGGGGDHWEG